MSAYGNEAVFNGTHYEPAVGEVYGYGKVYDPAVLAEGEECELAYENNVNAGTAKVVITGVGNAKGKMVKEFTIKPASIKDELIVLSRSAFAYNGKVQRPEVKSVGGKALKEDADYTLMCSNASSTQVGTYTVLVVGKGNYEGTSSGATYEIVKASQSIKASNCSAVAKAKKAGKTRALAKNATVNLKAKAKVSAKTAVKYAKVGKAGGSKIAVNAKTGKVTLKKGLKAGTYKLKVKLTAAADANYKAAKAKTITLAVKVK